MQDYIRHNTTRLQHTMTAFLNLDSTLWDAHAFTTPEVPETGVERETAEQLPIARDTMARLQAFYRGHGSVHYDRVSAQGFSGC